MIVTTFQQSHCCPHQVTKISEFEWKNTDTDKLKTKTKQKTTTTKQQLVMCLNTNGEWACAQTKHFKIIYQSISKSLST